MVTFKWKETALKDETHTVFRSNMFLFEHVSEGTDESVE